jgi:hypothetical protein
MSENNNKADVFAALQSLSEVVPELRLGQLFAAVGELCADLHGRGLWDTDDAELLEAVWQFQRNFERATIKAGVPGGQEADQKASSDRGSNASSPGPRPLDRRSK